MSPDIHKQILYAFHIIWAEKIIGPMKKSQIIGLSNYVILHIYIYIKYLISAIPYYISY